MTFLLTLSLAAVPPLLAVAQEGFAANTGNAAQQVRQANDEEVQAFLHEDCEALARLWSGDLVVTNPLNKFVNKREVLDMMSSGFLKITS
jgi:hypothetical protein